MTIQLDWKIAAVLAMLSLSVYNILMKNFFNKSYDWRAFIPIIFAGSLVAFVYFLISYKSFAFNSSVLSLAIPILLFAGLMALLSLYAIQNGSISVVAAVLAISTPITALLAAYFLNENLTVMQWVGIVLGMVSIYLVSAT
ncbi:hypothetical protein DRN67_03415 [Candidatus Micrarchaeota archaeon]|nr:MAG: hypothetical protein DRN67_03415 [Candidatus Micrarchaeota archaeon]